MIQVFEIFKSIQGESSQAGLPFVFIRLVGCNLRCKYCDTTYAYEGGKQMSNLEILECIQPFGIKRILITGGEPLMQSGMPNLAHTLLEKGYNVFVETNGSLNIGLLPKSAVRIMDIKCPSSGMQKRNRWENIELLRPNDEIKLVIANREDFDWAKKTIQKRHLENRCGILLSPVHKVLDPSTLVSWMLEDRLDARLNLQLHRIIWPDVDRGV